LSNSTIYLFINIDVLASFAALDGMADENVFNHSLSRLYGKENVDGLINFSSYIALRENYSSSLNTLIGGIRLYGRQFIRASLMDQVIESSVDSSSFSFDTILEKIPSTILSSQILTLKKDLNELIQSSGNTFFTYSDLVNLILSNSSIYNLSIRTQKDFRPQKNDIAQITVDNSGERTFALSKDGVLHVYDNNTNDKIFSQRILWAEPLMSRSVEGKDKHIQWLRHSGIPIPHDDSSSSSNSSEKFREIILLSKIFSEYSFLINPTTNFINVDPDSGFIVVNASIISGSICIHEPSSLRRIYRIKSPGNLSKELEKTLRDLSYSKDYKPKPIVDSTGVVENIKIWSQRSLLFCNLVGYKNLYVLNMLTGELLNELSGHTGSLTCIGKRKTHIEYTYYSD